MVIMIISSYRTINPDISPQINYTISIPRNNESSGLLINEHQASGDILRWNRLRQAVF